MSLEKLPIEGVVVERKGVKVKELIEQLLKCDSEMYVATKDCCYGTDFDVDPYVVTVTYPGWQEKEIGLNEGDEYLLIS